MINLNGTIPALEESQILRSRGYNSMTMFFAKDPMKSIKGSTVRLLISGEVRVTNWEYGNIIKVDCNV